MSTNDRNHAHEGVLPGVHEWMALSDDLLAGLVHALNNRVTAMTACAELLTLGDRQVASDGLLPAEVVRLQRTSALISLLPARETPAEATELAVVLEDAVALHAHHPQLRTVECTVERSGPRQAVRAPRWALLRLLTLLVHAAKSAAGAERLERATLHLFGDDARVALRAISREGVGDYAAAMVERCNGVLEHEGDELTIVLPSLAEVRRRERAARSSG